MKNLLTATLPALALLALGGCATSGALTTSTENDGVYYSSSDRTTAVAAPVYSGNSGGNIPARALDDTVPAATTDDANPDYQGGTAQGYAAGPDYYSNSYNDGLSYYTPSGFNQPYAGPGVSSYNYNPAWTVAPSFYGSPFGYGAGLALGYGYLPYSMGGFGYPYGGFYDPFYSPFYSPWGYGYGSGLSIGFGYGFGGFGGFGYPYGGFGGFGGYPYGGYGRGYGYYDGYGAGYGRPVIYANGTRSGSGSNPILVGPRGGRGGSILNSGTSTNSGMVNGGGRPGTYTGGYVTGSNGRAPAPAPNPAGTYDPTTKAGRTAATYGGGQLVGQPSYSTPGNPSGATAGNPGNMPQTQNNGRRGFFGGFFGNPNATPGAANNPGGQPATGQRRSYSQPQYSNGGGYSQPARREYSQPAYSQPSQQTRSYSQPSYSQPSQPSRSFGGGGGGNFGGGNGGGGGGGRRGSR